jgi:hypothetical protein
MNKGRNNKVRIELSGIELGENLNYTFIIVYEVRAEETNERVWSRKSV